MKVLEAGLNYGRGSAEGFLLVQRSPPLTFHPGLLQPGTAFLLMTAQL